ncbi:MAG: ATP-grasp domain-containing protein [Gammaproteobacteria bacterium]|nr:ATP-grasp domain-containing protein [Gammaproteobacteria bacterium]
MAVDAFADIDTIAVCQECWCVPLNSGEFEASKLSTCLSRLKTNYSNAKIILGAGSEHFAGLIESIEGWTLLSSDISTLSKVNRPKEFFRALTDLNIPFPEINFNIAPAANDWLYKRPSSCGGVGISRSNSLRIEALSGYWQREMVGVSMSALCISDQREHVIIGINQQYVNSNFDALPYLYEGALANAFISKENLIKIESYVDKLISYFNLVGVFSMDMVVARGEVFVIEINPRISASYELYEQLNPGLNLVDAHIRVCEGERLSNILINSQNYALYGYLIIYADTDIEVHGDMLWPDWAKDKPESGRLISVGEPVCSVYVEAGNDAESVRTLLEERRKQILSLLKQ